MGKKKKFNHRLDALAYLKKDIDKGYDNHMNPKAWEYGSSSLGDPNYKEFTLIADKIWIYNLFQPIKGFYFSHCGTTFEVYFN